MLLIVSAVAALISVEPLLNDIGALGVVVAKPSGVDARNTW